MKGRILFIFCFIHAVAHAAFQVPFIIQSMNGVTHRYSCLCERYTDQDRLEWKPDPNSHYTITSYNDTSGFIYTMIEVSVTNGGGSGRSIQPPRCVLFTPYYIKEINP
ncbi:putative alpha chemokine ligand [Elephant endotheliotropic herpesvirus 2]|nr:ORF-N putative alpha chemokine ligand [Elephant endotheliotropic herpesvirus 2]AGZ17121.1 putative alpha chemokine ligand [Elephant endotheliotropic herpesvirus 2]AGZ17158.1 putative alpha chemokine ligand [Elephant endotheliotropic herpesvirus 2]AID07077.1 putative alpha chemokine ligand [Elephant endotheliotropic herpesvirus 2]UEH20546.1 putative alpha chemokine ligand [Elephant endotheliotropic herpesvirus 2]